MLGGLGKRGRQTKTKNNYDMSTAQQANGYLSNKFSSFQENNYSFFNSKNYNYNQQKNDSYCKAPYIIFTRIVWRFRNDIFMISKCRNPLALVFLISLLKAEVDGFFKYLRKEQRFS